MPNLVNSYDIYCLYFRYYEAVVVITFAVKFFLNVQELESPVPGLINGNYLHQQELYKQNGGLHSQTDIQMQNSIVAVPKSRVTSNYKHSAAPGDE